MHKPAKVVNHTQILLDQGCQTRGLLGATLHVDSRVEDRMMFFDLEITTFPGNGLCNVARSKVDLQKKKIFSSPASSHHLPSSGIVNQKQSPGCLKSR